MSAVEARAVPESWQKNQDRKNDHEREREERLRLWMDELQRRNALQAHAVGARLAALERGVESLREEVHRLPWRLSKSFDYVLDLQIGHEDDAIDWVYDRFDSLLSEHRFAQCDLLLAEAAASASRLATPVLLAILTVTAAAKDALSRRDGFVRLVEELVADRGQMEDGLLDGLG